MRRFLLTSTALTLVAVTSPAFADISLTTENGAVVINSDLSLSTPSNTPYPGSGTPSGTIQNTTLTSGTNSAVYNKGATLEFTALISNYNSGSANGAAISTGASLQGSLTLTASQLTNNQTTGSGGAIYNSGKTVNLNQSNFTNNHAKNGGAVFDYGSNNAAINTNETTFLTNNATENGGAIYLQNLRDNNNIITSTFKQNTAINGGAIYLEKSSASNKGLNITNGAFTDNIATSGQGGAIFIKQGNLNFSGGTTTFSGNMANNKANDIHLETSAIMNISSNASVKLDGGVSGSGIINIDGTLNIDISDAVTTQASAPSVAANTINFSTGSNLTLTISYNSSWLYGQLNATNLTTNGSITFNLDKSAKNAIDSGTHATITMSEFKEGWTNNDGYRYSYDGTNYIISKAYTFSGNTLYLFGSDVPAGYYPNEDSDKWGVKGSFEITDSMQSPAENIDIISNQASDGTKLTSGTTTAVINSANTADYQFDIQGYTNNSNSAKGGAVYNGSNKTLTVNQGSVFKNNHATQGNGGAIYNDGTLTVAQGSAFEGNSAQNGGAVYNASNQNLTIYGDSTITNNIATSEGGAVYNAGTLTLDTTNGDITFSGNMAQTDVANDIYNNGTLKISGGKTVSLGGGINNASSNKAGSIEVDGSILKLGRNADIYTNTLSFDNATLNAADGADLFANGDIGFTNTAVTLANSEINGSNLTFTGGSLALGTSSLTATNNLSFSNIGKIDASQATLNGKNISFDNAGIDIGSNELKADGDITFKNNSNLFLTVQNETQYGKLTATNITNNGGKMTVTVASNAFGSSDEITVDILNASGKLEEGDFNAPIAADNNFFEIKYNDADDGSYTITKKGDPTPTPTPGGETMGIAEAWQKAGFTSAGAEEVYQHLQHVSSLKDAYTALAPTEAPVIQTALIQIQNQIIGAVSSQLTGGLSSPVSEGKSAGDGILNKVRSWVKLLVNHAKYSAHNGFSSDVQGVSMGVDKLIHEDFRLGLGYAYTNGDIDGFWRSSDLTSHTAILYGEYKPSNWYVNGIATYGWADYEEKKNLQGLLVRSKYDVDSFGLQVMTGYDFGIYTPEIGLRYARFKRDGYRDTADQYVSSDTSDILTAIMGVKFEKQFTTCGGTRWKPEARLAATYDLITDEDNALVTLNNGAAYEAKGEHLKRFGVEFGAGVNIEVNDKVDVSFGYEGHFRKDYQDHTGMVNAIYKF